MYLFCIRDGPTTWVRWVRLCPMSRAYDIVVVGAGHAGCEAAASAARMGKRVACVTMDLSGVGRLSCNPAIGGLGKGHLVRELDALGGLMGQVADASSIQFRRLNTRKGLAVQASRCQVDIDVYPRTMRELLERIDGLDLVEGEVADLVLEEGRVKGVGLASGEILSATSVIITSGTFLSGVLHCGEETSQGGRLGDGSASTLATSLLAAGLRLARLKTGTVPRLDGRTIDWSKLSVQEDTLPDGRFSFAPPRPKLDQIACHVAYTNERVHEVIRTNVHRSPMYTGAITGAGPRYCPSIEDKVVRFADRERHLLFLEPEGLNTHRVYVNGMSTSLPKDVQEEMLRAVPGLEDAVIMQYGYAVEYDFADPRDLDMGLQHRRIPGLFLAGQVNGTSGYEEAAAQGFVAGVSAALGEPFVCSRDEAYIGVMIDDLVTRGVGGEPYRMFTSRAEHRLILREDNADRRLMPRGRELGLVEDGAWDLYIARQEAFDGAMKALRACQVVPNASSRAQLEAWGLGGLKKPSSGEQLLRRPGATWGHLVELLGLPELDRAVAEQVEIEVKYAGYIERATRRAASSSRWDDVHLPQSVDWEALSFLSTEVRQRLQEATPQTLGQAGRLPGVTPAAVNALGMWLQAQKRSAGGAGV